MGKEGFESFLTDEDEAEEGVEYIKPDIELKLSSAKRQECREVVQEIKRFGIRGQRQLLYLIYLLALEIERPDVMKGIVSLCKLGRKELAEGNQIITDLEE